ncbi:MAG: class I SAM-dependent methyltransferase [Thermodesulfobacteriota bacterium]
MARLSAAERRRIALDAGRARMYQQDKIWSRYSNDKVDIALTLGRVIRSLNHALPLASPMTALSIGSSNEPQFRILASAFQGGLTLLDIEEAALDVVAERIARQRTKHVRLVRGDYVKLLGSDESAARFRARALGGRRVTLVTLHHSLYYSARGAWPGLVRRIYRHLLATRPGPGPTAAIHAVLMAPRSDDRSSTSWLYEHFAGRYFGVVNDQDLRAFAGELRKDPAFADAQVLTRSTVVDFFVDDFALFMAVVWMILLYPNVHRYSAEQRVEITEHVYRELWSRGRPLVQRQDHVVVYRGRRERALA